MTAPEPTDVEQAGIGQLPGVPEAKALEAAQATVDAWRAGGDLVDKVSTIPDVSRWQQMEQMAARIARTNLVPRHIRESRDPEGDCIVTLLMAHDLGISATLAFQKTAVIEGKPAQMSELMRILAVRDGHRVWFTISRDDKGRAVAATCHVHRKDDPADLVSSSEYTLEDAVVAGLCTTDPQSGNPKARDRNDKKLPWEKFTEDMLVARATSRELRRSCPDSLGGVSYTPEELGAIEVENEDVVLASDPVREALIAKIAALPEEGKALVASRWKERKLGSLKVDTKMRRLNMDEIADAYTLLDDLERELPADAEIVEPDTRHAFEGPDDSDQCATCGLAPDAFVHECADCTHPWDRHAREGGCLFVLHDGAGTATGSCVCTEAGISEDSRDDARDSAPRSTTTEADTTVAADLTDQAGGSDGAPEGPEGGSGDPGGQSGGFLRLLGAGTKTANRVAQIQVPEGDPVTVPYKGNAIAVDTPVEWTAGRGGERLTGVVVETWQRGSEPF